ncbi:hypothetical protein ACS78_27615 [Priestia megaterium]|uniref:hypothetical protein n=1 Tax=Priestia megaterium TaxID=1404 RepID=UPI000681B606|nr:hypothetical protein [Priestia megaterium]KNH13895.1 hypothetical protein ACS78_27615 [Priestia megaterium]
MKNFLEQDIVQGEADRYKSLLKVEGRISKIKNFCLGVPVLLFILSIALNPYYPKPQWFYYSFNTRYSILIAFFLYIIITFSMHYLALKCIKNPYLSSLNEDTESNNIRKINLKRTNLFLLIISPDYFFAKTFKNFINDFYSNKDCTCEANCPSSKNGNKEISFCNWDSIKNARRFFIEFSNWFNVIVTVLCTFIIVVCIRDNEGFLVDIIYYLLCYRIISRSIEILYAYFKDVVKVDSIIFTNKSNESKYINNWKSSSLRKTARVSLAIHTLVEVVLVFSLFYYLTYWRIIDECIECLPDVLDKTQFVDFYSFVLYSISISSFNFSFTSYHYLIWTLAHVLQVLLSMILIVLSLAQYISNNDEMSARDERFFLKVGTSPKK